MAWSASLRSSRGELAAPELVRRGSRVGGVSSRVGVLSLAFAAWTSYREDRSPISSFPFADLSRKQIAGPTSSLPDNSISGHIGLFADAGAGENTVKRVAAGLASFALTHGSAELGVVAVAVRQ